ncbi:hypothetical protein Ocin01_15270 [Orchesella cincta]|uniref:Uncharacterized protein n=1 Tax=Orchesella cincta TaxID=48709 RepID=A0A1D2MEQ0_ORCCI|nr:hypothetical protein Ocin01_15270 [Orchesella cincta]
MRIRTRASATRWYCSHCEKDSHFYYCATSSGSPGTQSYVGIFNADRYQQFPDAEGTLTYSNIRNADGEVNAGLVTKRRMQEEITAEEGVIGGMLEEVKTLEKVIATHKAVAEKMMDLYGQTAGGGNIKYVSSDIDKEKASITENEKTLVVLQKDVREKQVKLQNWKELMEKV